MDLLVQLEHRMRNTPAASAFQHKSKVIDGFAMAQTFGSPRQCRFAQFSPWSHLLPLSLRRDTPCMNSRKKVSPRVAHPRLIWLRLAVGNLASRRGEQLQSHIIRRSSFCYLRCTR